jgi:hypothetical protein
MEKQMAFYYDPEEIVLRVKQELPNTYGNILKKAELYQKLVFKELAYGYYLANMDQINNNQLPFSLARIRNQLGRYGKPQRYWWDWLHSNFPLVKVISKGNSIQGVNSMVEIDIPIDILIAGQNSKDLVDALYAKFDANTEVHAAPINLRNLDNYIRATTAENNPNPTIQNNLKTARIIYMVAKHFEEQTGQAQLPQIVNYSSFGRTYYKGVNLQNIHKTVREAALGPCYSVDINSSVFNWKYAVSPFKQELTYTRELIQDKDRIRKHLAQVVFGNTSDYSIKTVKRILTAISFGAKSETRCWFKNDQNQWTQGAVSEIIHSKELRDVLFNDTWMKQFMREQERINKHIGDDLAQAARDGAIPESAQKDLRSERGRISKGKLIAWAYQQSEQQIMNELLKWSRTDVLLQVHDGVYFRTKPDMPSMQTVLQDHWLLATLSIQEVKQYLYVDHESAQAHRQHIQNEERAANNGVLVSTHGIQSERMAQRQYDPHGEPDWETQMMRDFEATLEPQQPDWVKELMKR